MPVHLSHFADYSCMTKMLPELPSQQFWNKQIRGDPSEKYINGMNEGRSKENRGTEARIRKTLIKVVLGMQIHLEKATKNCLTTQCS